MRLNCVNEVNTHSGEQRLYSCESVPSAFINFCIGMSERPKFSAAHTCQTQGGEDLCARRVSLLMESSVLSRHRNIASRKTNRRSIASRIFRFLTAHLRLGKRN